MDAILEGSSLPGASDLEAERATLLMRAKGEPAFFIRTPEFSANPSKDAGYLRHLLVSTRYPWGLLQQLLPRFEREPELGRAVLLREGYLYTTDPELGFALVSLIGPHHVYETERIWVERGARLMHASRRDGRYVYDDGPLRGEPVKLLMFDRLGTDSGPSAPALHRDFRSLAYQLGFDRVRVRHIGQEQLLVDLRYEGSLWVPTLLKSNGARLEFELEQPGAASGELGELRARALSRVRGVQALRHAILLQIEERLPFDEPRNEAGQEDGKLRRSFRHVYEQGRNSFKIRNDHYSVFDALGRPLAPQVCIDFLLDTFERASGTWWGRQDEARRLSEGRLNFESYLPRNVLRRAHEFIGFTRAQPELFDVVEIPAREWIPQGNKPAFFAYLARHLELFRPGDMVLIRGVTPWDDGQEHYHSFFIYETDPMSGAPIAIVGNAGTPAIWSWESEARRTPLRSLRFRIRPTLGLLERVAGDQPNLAPEPPPLVSGFTPSS